MNRWQSDLRVQAVARDYDPGYPARLSPDEFREFIERRAHRRVRDLAFAAALLLEAPRPTAPVDLEARVLSVLTGLRAQEKRSAWFRESRFQPVEPSERPFAWSPAWSVSVPIAFGNSANGVFDTALARETAAAMFAAYGIELSGNVHVSHAGAEATIDGYDEETRLGFEVRDRETFRTPNGPSRNTPASIPAEQHLDDDEARRLHAEGYRVHVADPQRLYDGDDFTAVMTYVAGLVDYLNEVTDGPDLDLGAILFGEKQRLHPAPATRYGATNAGGAWTVRTTVDDDVVWAVRYNDPESPPPQQAGTSRGRLREWSELAAPLPTVGHPTMLSFAWYREHGEVPTVRVIQGAISVETRASEVFLPSGFDAAQPFEVRFAVPKGEIFLDLSVLVGAPKR